MMTLTIFRAAGFVLALAIVLVTVLPIGLRPVSPFPVSIERIGAYATLGLCLGLAYPGRRGWVIAALVAFAALLEAGQTLTGSRHGRVEDFLVKAGGAAAGVVIAAVVARLARHARRVRS